MKLALFTISLLAISFSAKLQTPSEQSGQEVSVSEKKGPEMPDWIDRRPEPHRRTIDEIMDDPYIPPVHTKPSEPGFWSTFKMPIMVAVILLLGVIGRGIRNK